MLAVGKLTVRATMSSPFVLGLALFLAAAIALAPRMILFGFGDDARIVRETGASALRVGALAAALLAGTGQGRRGPVLALLLSRPLTPAGLILGRYLGALAIAVVMLSMLSAVLYGTLRAHALEATGVGTECLAAGLDAATLTAAAVALGGALPQPFAALALAGLFIVAHGAPEGTLGTLLASGGRPIAALAGTLGALAAGAAIAEAREPGA